MLVLSRKVGEQVVIGDNITVVVQRIAGGRVSLAIKAPNNVRILRSELNVFEEEPAAAKTASPKDKPRRSAPLPSTEPNVAAEPFANSTSSTVVYV